MSTGKTFRHGQILRLVSDQRIGNQEELRRRLSAQKATNDSLERRNVALGAEGRDLKQGFDAIEERARYELGFVKPDEVFFQVIETPKPAPKAAAERQP